MMELTFAMTSSILEFNFASVELGAIECLNGVFSVSRILELDKSESFRSSGVVVQWDRNVVHLAILTEQLANVVLTRIGMYIADEDRDHLLGARHCFLVFLSLLVKVSKFEFAPPDLGSSYVRASNSESNRTLPQFGMLSLSFCRTYRNDD